MSAEPTITTVESNGFTITSNSGGSPEQIAESLKVGQDPPSSGEGEPPDLSKAASELGKKGGAAAAKARAKADKAKEPETGEAAEAKASDQDAAEEPEQPAEPEKDAKKGNPRHDPQARVAQATREAAEARREAAEARREAAEARARLERLERDRQARETPAAAPQTAQDARTAPDADEEPREEDYESYKDFVKATATWQYRQEAREAQKQFYAHQAAAAAADKLDKTIGGFKDAVSKAGPDFAASLSPEVSGLQPSFTLERGERPGPSNWIADEFLSAPERAPALMLYLSEHPQDFQRIAALSSPRAITRELAKLEVGLEAATAGTSAKPESSKANPPVRPVTGAPSVASGSGGPRPGETFDEWYVRTQKPVRR